MKAKVFEVIRTSSQEVSDAALNAAVDVSRAQKRRAARLLRSKRDKIIRTKDISDPIIQDILRLMTQQIAALNS